MKGLRMGLHVQHNHVADKAIEYCRRVQPTVMKWLDPEESIIRRCMAVSPNTRHISRVVWSPQESPEDYRAFMNKTLDRARRLRGLVRWHEGWNEHIPRDATDGDIRAFVNQELDLAKSLNAIGVGALIGGFSTGTLDEGRIEPFAKGFEYMQRVGPDLCALHAHFYGGGYIALNVKTPDGLNQWPDGGQWTGATTDARLYDDPELRGWLFLRHRDLRPQLLARGWDKVTLYITESGVDAVNKNPGGRRGFRDYRGTEWERLPGMGDFASQMRWAAVQLGHDDWVRGAVEYGFGGGPPDIWGDFDLSLDPAMFERFMVEQASIPRGAPAPATIPAPVPQPPPVPVPSPTPPVPVLLPPSALAVAPRFIALKGDGWTSAARRALGREPKVKEVAALKAANGGGTGPAIGAYLLSPWHRVERVS